jgi:DNA helicase-2/ATP-dependent DNA helicase PcrA
VAITRAKETLTISHARQRMLYGRTNASMASRFLRELPQDDIERKGGYLNPQTSHSYGNFDAQFRPRQETQWNAPKNVYANRTPSSGPVLELNKGDMVNHTAFGRGMVLSVMKMGGDALLEIAFDQIGTKKLMAKTASAHMKKL